MTEVGIIGAGPAGLAAARYLASEGFEPVLFEQGAAVGGQWSGERAHSGIWPSMRTNTSRILTAFSDLPHAAGSHVYPSNQSIREYLRAYAERFSLTSRVHLRTPVVGLEPRVGGPGWLVRTPSAERAFAHVVVATGAFHRWTLPPVPGLASFSGAGGVAHTYQYPDAGGFRGLRVLVAGGAISALEIASDLAMAGAASVTVSVRRQRYVLPKLAAGTPTDHIVFTRFHALAEEAFPAERANQMYTDAAVRLGGRPEYYGAPAAAATIAEAGLTLCQHFLPLVAEGRIDVHPWMTGVDGKMVRFSDGHADEFDAILFATGFELHLPFLPPSVRDILGLDAHHIELHLRTFHPAAARPGVRRIVGSGRSLLSTDRASSTLDRLHLERRPSSAVGRRDDRRCHGVPRTPWIPAEGTHEPGVTAVRPGCGRRAVARALAPFDDAAAVRTPQPGVVPARGA